MAQDKRTFMGGMNKDVDIRLIKNPDYINALNVRVVSSTDGTIGSLENIEGNEEVPFNFYSTDQDVHFVNDNGLYEQINPSTVFYQKVIRIEGWEQVNVNYNFSLYSISPNGNVLIGEFNWVGNNGHNFTSQYLNSQFGGIGNFSSDIIVYDNNTGAEYTASVKLLAFGSNAALNGGYFDIIIECDTPGVNFSLSASSSFNPGEFSYSYSEGSSVPISSNENVSISLLPSFETGGSYNAEATDQGFVISPDGAPYQVDNRTVWTITFAGSEPTSPESFTEINVYSYRSNLNPGEQNETFESRVLFTIDPNLFNTGGAHEFDSNQNNLAEFLHSEFSESKVILCDGLPLDFTLPSDSFFLTFSETQSFDNSIVFKVLVVGPVGVRFKLALAQSSEFLNQALSEADDLGVAGIDSSTLFNNGSLVILNAFQIVENSIAITDSIISTFDSIQDELNNTISNFEELTTQMGQLITTNNNLESDLEVQQGLTATALANLADTQDQLAAANLANAQLESANSELTDLNFDQANNLLSAASQISGLEDNLAILQSDYAQLQETLLDEQATSSDYYSQLIACQSDVASMTLSHADTIANIEATLGEEIDDLTLANSNLQSALDGANDLNVSLINEATNTQNAHTAQLNQIAIDHQAAIDGIILDYTGQLSEQQTFYEGQLATQQLDYEGQLTTQEEDYEAQIASIQAQAEDDINAANATAQAQIDELESQIDGLNSEIASQDATILGNQATIQQLNNQISELQEQIANLVISDLIVETTLQNYDDLYTSLSNLYNDSFFVFNALSITNASVYEEDFSSVSDFSNEWVFYNVDWMNFDETPSPITDVSGGSYSNALLDVENDGYLKIPTRTNNYTAARLPYNSFQNAGGWQHGSEITITLTFDVVNNSTTPGQGSFNYLDPVRVYITNEWDNTGEFENATDSAFFQQYDVVSNAGGSGQYNVVNANPFSLTYTVVDDNLDNFLDRLCNITILVEPVPNTDIEVRLIDIRLGNTAQEMFSFDLSNTVPIRRDSYLELYNEYNTYVLEWQNSGLDSLEDFVGTSQYGAILNRVIPGYNDNPNLSEAYTIGGRLQKYAEAVIDFSSSVQTQIYQQYLSYTVASGLVPEDIADTISFNDEQILELQSQLEAAQGEIAQLEQDLIYVQQNPGTFLTGPNIGATVLTIMGDRGAQSPDLSPDNTLMSQNAIWSFDPVPPGGFLELPIIFLIDGQEQTVDTFDFLSGAELDALQYEPYSETNNLVYYITNRFQNGQTIDFQIPGGEYPTQKLNILFANFNEDSSPLSGECPFITLNAGINIEGEPFAQIEDIDSLDDLYNYRALQVIFYFDQSLGNNVGTDDVYFKRVSVPDTTFIINPNVSFLFAPTAYTYVEQVNNFGG